MKNKKTQKNRNTRVSGISFPKDPIDVLPWAKKQAKKKNRNLSNYIADLILQDKEKEEVSNG